MHGENVSLILTDPVASAACPRCGALLDVTGLPAFADVQCPTCEFEFQVPSRLGAFLLLQLLGMGGMGGVYRARDEALNREVAIKVMLKSLGDDPQFVETFQREAQAAAKLNHPNIAQIYSFGQEKGQPYIVMELVSGGSLDKMMAEQGPLDPAVVIHVGLQVAEGLREAAEAGMVHGDVKPENILFDNDKNAKLVDFGLSAMASGPGNDVWGTPYYIAPEKVRRQKSDFRSDIYSLGGTLYHAIAGVPPFEGEDATAVVKARFDGPPKPLREYRMGIPDEVEALVSRMLAVEPQTRYPTYGSLLGDMRRYLSKAGPIKMEKSNKKIMIKGKRGSATTGNMSGTAGMTGVVGELPPGMTPVGEIEEPVESEEAARKRGSKMILKVVAGLVVLVGVVVGTIYGFKHAASEKQRKAEVAQIEKSQSSARASIAKTVATARATVERVQKFEPEALGYAKAAADEVARVLGEEVRAAMVPPEPDAPVQPEAAAEPAAPAAAEGGKISLDPAMLEGLLKQLPPEVAEKVKALEKMPPEEALATLEELAKALPPEKAAELKAGLEMLKTVAGGMAGMMQQMAGGMAAAMSNAMGEVAAQLTEKLQGGDAAPDAEAAGAGDVHPVVTIVRGMYADAYVVKGSVKLAEALLAEIEASAKEAEKLTQVEKEAAESLVKLANGMVEKAKNLGYGRISEVPRRVSQLRRTLESVKTDVASLVELRRQEALEQEKRQKADAEADKRRQAQEAQAQKVAAERERVNEAEAANAGLVRQLQFREATRAIKLVADEMETDEGKLAAAIALERVNRVKDFHTYLVEKVVGFKSSRGWSIDGADHRNLSVAGRKIPWTEVFEKRMEIVGELVMGLVLDDQATKAMRLREKTRLMTNASLCLNLFYKSVPSAQELAKRLANDAAQQFDVDADSIKQLLPEFF